MIIFALGVLSGLVLSILATLVLLLNKPAIERYITKAEQYAKRKPAKIIDLDNPLKDL